jgi:type VI protein secretion system component VasF
MPDEKSLHDRIRCVFQGVPRLQGTLEDRGEGRMNLNWHEWSWMIGALAVLGVLGFVFWSMLLAAKRDDELNQMGE